MKRLVPALVLTVLTFAPLLWLVEWGWSFFDQPVTNCCNPNVDK